MRKTFRWGIAVLTCFLVIALLAMAGFGFTERSDSSASPGKPGKNENTSWQDDAFVPVIPGEAELTGLQNPGLLDSPADIVGNETSKAANDNTATEPAEPEIFKVEPSSDTLLPEAVASTSPEPEPGPEPSPDFEPSPEPESEPVPEPEPKPEPAPPPPVSYVWGGAKTYHFRTEVVVTNDSAKVSREVKIHLPMLENNSPYQTTVLQSTNYTVEATSGRVGTFDIGDLQPGETKSVIADYAITVRPVSIKSTNATVDTAREIYTQFAGSGNCYELASGFVKQAREAGLKARVVNGFARPQKGDMTAGSLQGVRHSWAEFFVDGLGWAPVDLTFQYFADFPYRSHIVETYTDQSIRVNFKGGSLSVSWRNSIV